MNRPAHGNGLIEVLLVEDNPGDVRLIMEAFRETKLLIHVSVAEDGVQALAMLRRQGSHVRAPRPDLVVLDLNLPLKDGREVLAEIKEDPELQHIPVVILTTSNADQDILKAYKHHANCYITKPIQLEQFLAVARSIEDFWLSVVSLPPG